MHELSPTVRYVLATERKLKELQLDRAQRDYEDAPRRIKFLQTQLYELKIALGEA